MNKRMQEVQQALLEQLQRRGNLSLKALSGSVGWASPSEVETNVQMLQREGRVQVARGPRGGGPLRVNLV